MLSSRHNRLVVSRAQGNEILRIIGTVIFGFLTVVKLVARQIDILKCVVNTIYND